MITIKNNKQIFNCQSMEQVYSILVSIKDNFYIENKDGIINIDYRGFMVIDELPKGAKVCYEKRPLGYVECKGKPPKKSVASKGIEIPLPKKLRKPTLSKNFKIRAEEECIETPFTKKVRKPTLSKNFKIRKVNNVYTLFN